jgi:hypothetical protein
LARDDHRREANGEQFRSIVALVAKNKPSVDFCGYWRRSRGHHQCLLQIWSVHLAGSMNIDQEIEMIYYGLIRELQLNSNVDFVLPDVTRGRSVVNGS